MNKHHDISYQHDQYESQLVFHVLAESHWKDSHSVLFTVTSLNGIRYGNTASNGVIEKERTYTLKEDRDGEFSSRLEFEWLATLDFDSMTTRIVNSRMMEIAGQQKRVRFWNRRINRFIEFTVLCPRHMSSADMKNHFSVFLQNGEEVTLPIGITFTTD